MCSLFFRTAICALFALTGQQTVLVAAPQAETVITAGNVSTLVDDLDGGTGGLSIDKDGNLYSGDFGWRLDGRGKGGDKILKIKPDGTVTVFCRQMRGASGNFMDCDGNLYQSSIGGNYISKIGTNGTVQVVSKNSLKSPVGVIKDKANNLFVCNCGSNTIQKITPGGESSVFCNSKLLNCPNGIAQGNDGSLYVCNFSNGDVIKIDSSGQASRLATLPGNNNGHLIYYKGALFVIARMDNRIYKVALDGTARHFAGNGKRGKDDGTANDASFSLPNSLTVSPDGKFIYVNETSPIKGDHRILGPTRIRRIELKQHNAENAPKERIVQQPNPDASKMVQKVQSLFGKGKFAEAEEVLKSADSQIKKLPLTRYLLAYSYHGQRKYDEAKPIYETTKSIERLKTNSLYNLACIHSLQEDPDEAIEYLKLAIESGFNDFGHMKTDSDLENIKSDPRFVDLIKK